MKLELKHIAPYLLIIFIYCASCNDVKNTRYHKGDMVYLKPDSMKAVIVGINWRGWREIYDVKTVEKKAWYQEEIDNISEEEIY